MTLTSETTAELLAAMDIYKIIARQLIDKLISETDQPAIDAIKAGSYHAIEDADLLNGDDELSGNWSFAVHGEHCLFQNSTTRQTLEVSLGDETSLGDLDPYFFYKFLKTTDNLSHLAEQFPRPFSDMLTFFEALEEREILRHIHGVEYRKQI